MAKIIPKKVREKIVELRDEEGLSWPTIGQQTDLHRETVRKQYLLEKKGEVGSPYATERGLVPPGQTPRLSVNEEYQLLAKRQRVLQALDDYIAVVESQDWDYVEDDVFLLRERLDFLRARAESADDIDSLSQIDGLLLEERDNLDKLGEEQARAESKARERERQKQLSYIKEYYLNRGGPQKDVQSLIDDLAKHGGIKAALQLVKDLEAMEDLRLQCFHSGIDSQFVEGVLFYSIPKIPEITYVRRLWFDAQRISYYFGSQEFGRFWGYWARSIIQGRQSLWLTFLGWKGLASPAWAGYQFLNNITH